MKKKRQGDVDSVVSNTYLIRVHLELADDLDSHLSDFSVQIACTVDIAERAIAHLLYQLPSLESWVSRQFAFALVLFRNYPLQLLLVDLLVTFLLVLLSLVRCRIVGLRSSVSVVQICRRECVSAWDLVCLVRHQVRVSVGVVVRGRGIVVIAILVDVDGRDMCRWVVLGLICRSSLLPCEDCKQRHDSVRPQRGRRRGRFTNRGG